MAQRRSPIIRIREEAPMKSIAALSLFALIVITAPKAAHACGALHSIASHDGTQSAYSIAGPETGAKGILLLLTGDGWVSRP